MLQSIRKWIDHNRDLILETNRTLVSIPSENRYPNGDELQVQFEVNRLLNRIGFQTDWFLPTDLPELTQHVAYLAGRNYENRPNVVGTMKGAGGGKSLIFSGHMDTVPRGVEPWSKDPFAGEVIDGKQYGLGIYDMKGGMAAAMMAAQCIRDLGYRTKGDLMIECVVDEEYGGANGTLACRLRGYEADAAIVPEPTNLILSPVNQGGGYYRISFEGTSGRSYNGEELVNPVFAAARFMEIVQDYHLWRNRNRSTPPMFADNPELPTLIQSLRAGDFGVDLSDRVPKTCSFDVWMQVYPGTTEEELFTEFTTFYTAAMENDEILAKSPPIVEKKIRFLPGSGVAEDHPIVRALKEVGEDVNGEALQCQGAPFACDSFMFNLYSNTPAVILGPSGGNAHAPDEFIWVDDFMKLIEIYANMIVKWCGVTKIDSQE